MRSIRLALIILIFSLGARAVGAPAEEKKADPVPKPVAVRSVLRDRLPADCLALLEIPDYKKFCESGARIASKILPMDWRDLSDQLLAYRGFEFPPGFARMIDPAGPVGIAIFPPEQTRGPVFLFRVADPKKFPVGAGGIGERRMRRGIFRYALLGKIGVISEDKDIIKRIAANFGAGEKIRTRMKQTDCPGDLLVSVNLKAVASRYNRQIRHQLSKVKEEIQGKPEKPPGGGAAAWTCPDHAHRKSPIPAKCPICKKNMVLAGAPPARVVRKRPLPDWFPAFEMLRKQVTGNLGAVESCTLGITLDKSGARIAFAFRALPGSPLGKKFASTHQPDLRALSLLPAEAKRLLAVDTGGGPLKDITFLNDLFGVMNKKEYAIQSLAARDPKLLATFTGRIVEGWMARKDKKAFGTMLSVAQVKNPKSFAAADGLRNADARRVLRAFQKRAEALGIPHLKLQVGDRKELFTHAGVKVWRHAVTPEAGASPIRRKATDLFLGGGVYTALAGDLAVTVVGSEPAKWIKAFLDNRKNGKPVVTKSGPFAQVFPRGVAGAHLVSTARSFRFVASALSFAEEVGKKEWNARQRKRLRLIKNQIQKRDSLCGLLVRFRGPTVTGEVQLPARQIDEIVEVVVTVAFIEALEKDRVRPRRRRTR